MDGKTFRKASDLNMRLYKLNSLKRNFMSEECAISSYKSNNAHALSLSEFDNELKTEILDAVLQIINAEIEKTEEEFRKL